MPFLKGPTEVLDFTIDWTQWLGSDTISSSTWVVPAGITKDSDTTVSSLAALIWLSGGSLGQIYELVNTIVTAAGRTAVRSIDIECTQR